VFSILQPIMDSARCPVRNSPPALKEIVMKTLRTRLARSLARAHRGMTLLEIMNRARDPGLVMGLLVGPKVMAAFGKSKIDTTKIKLSQYANEAYPQCRRTTPTSSAPRSCPISTSR